jgi:hypothetical protein
MAAKFKPIKTEDMHNFLTAIGFTRINAITAQSRELVYGKIIKHGICLRVYTSLVGEQVRTVGADAIRLAVVKRQPDGSIIGIGKAKRVHRVENWRANLLSRIMETTERFSS